MAFDIANIISKAKAEQFFNAGHHAIGVYSRTDRCTPMMIDDLHAVGFKLFTIIEHGNATNLKFFDADNAKRNADEALEWALKVKQPKFTTMSPCYDTETTGKQVVPYADPIHAILKGPDFFNLPYGDGITLEQLIKDGLAVGGYLSQSTGFPGYRDFYHKAAILQGPTHTLFGEDIDLDSIQIPVITSLAQTIKVLW